jgi:His Kinase A (phospho-acceptor) domain
VTDPVVGTEVHRTPPASRHADRGRPEDLVQETITRFGIWAARWQLAGPWRALLFTGFAGLSIAVIVLRFASVTTDVLAFLAAVVVGFLAHGVADRTEQDAGPAAGADRMRAALLAAVSHDLRSPLAAAAAAVSCLRSRDLQVTAADQDELLATAEESLDLLSRLAASLLDVSRLQAGARSVFPRPADLEEIIECSLAGLGPPGRNVQVDLPPGLPKVVADPPVMERVIPNLTAKCTAVLAGRITAAADRQRPQGPDRAARNRLRTGRPRGGQREDVCALPAARRYRQHDWRRARARSIPGPDRGDAWQAPTRPDPWRRPDNDDVTACGTQAEPGLSAGRQASRD